MNLSDTLGAAKNAQALHVEWVIFASPSENRWPEELIGNLKREGPIIGLRWLGHGNLPGVREPLSYVLGKVVCEQTMVDGVITRGPWWLMESLLTHRMISADDYEIIDQLTYDPSPLVPIS